MRTVVCRCSRLILRFRASAIRFPLSPSTASVVRGEVQMILAVENTWKVCRVNKSFPHVLMSRFREDRMHSVLWIKSEWLPPVDSSFVQITGQYLLCFLLVLLIFLTFYPSICDTREPCTNTICPPEWHRSWVIGWEPNQTASLVFLSFRDDSVYRSGLSDKHRNV